MHRWSRTRGNRGRSQQVAMNIQQQPSRKSIIDTLASEWKPREIRDLATTLLRLADSVEQDWAGPQSSGGFHWPTALNRIERNAPNLAWQASLLYERRRHRAEHLPATLLGEPAWDMLLDLFMQYAGGAKVSTTSLAIAAECPPTTALRHIDQLVLAGLVKRCPASHDKRMVFVELTDRGIVAMGQYLETIN